MILQVRGRSIPERSRKGPTQGIGAHRKHNALWDIHGIAFKLKDSCAHYKCKQSGGAQGKAPCKDKLGFLETSSIGTDSTNRRPVFSSVSEMESTLVLLERANVGIKIDNYNKNPFTPRSGFLFLYILEPRNVIFQRY